MASGFSTAVEHLPSYVRVEGSIPASSAGSGRKQYPRKKSFWNQTFHFSYDRTISMGLRRPHSRRLWGQPRPRRRRGRRFEASPGKAGSLQLLGGEEVERGGLVFGGDGPGTFQHHPGIYLWRHGFEHNDTQQNDNQYNGTQNFDNQHNDSRITTMPSVIIILSI